MCTRDKEFTIRGTEDCLARGFDRTGFFEVDTGEQRTWTVQLTETGEQTPRSPHPARQPDDHHRRPPAASNLLPHPEARTMRRLRRTKIVATLGPASSERAMIARLFEAGADVFRINMSHTSHDKMRELVAAIRDVEKEYERPIGILVDLQGPKLRLGQFGGGSAMVKKGDTFTLDADTGARRRHARAPAASGNPAGDAARPDACCSTTARCA